MAFLIFDGLLANDQEPSLVEHQSTFQRLAEVGEVRRVSIEEGTLRESLLLGFNPHEVALNQGPLTVSALGFDPPEKSVHFHLSLLSLTGDAISQPNADPDNDELKVIKAEVEKLKTKLLTPLMSTGLDHGLVWEKLGEFRTVGPSRLDEKPYAAHLPIGDGENDLRRLIDDSVNILGELDFNRRRVDHGKSPLNILWPWGAGVRTTVPSLALRYGYPHSIATDSLRLRGLARLAGLRVQEIRGRETDLTLNDLSKKGQTLAYTTVFRQLRDRSKLEEADWLAHQIGEQVILPLLDSAKDEQSSLDILVLNSKAGLWFHFEGKPTDNMWPFDERTLSEAKAPVATLHETCQKAFVG